MTTLIEKINTNKLITKQSNNITNSCDIIASHFGLDENVRDIILDYCAINNNPFLTSTYKQSTDLPYDSSIITDIYVSLTDNNEPIQFSTEQQYFTAKKTTEHFRFEFNYKQNYLHIDIGKNIDQIKNFCTGSLFDIIITDGMIISDHGAKAYSDFFSRAPLFGHLKIRPNTSIVNSRKLLDLLCIVWEFLDDNKWCEHIAECHMIKEKLMETWNNIQSGKLFLL